MPDLLIPALVAVLVWWSGTALVFWMDGLPRRVTLPLVSALLGAGLVGIHALGDARSEEAAYAGFALGVLAWAWQEVAFLSGAVTGPNRAPLPEGTRGYPRFLAALRAILHHEVAILALGAVLLALSWGAANQVALHTYLLLWAMRQSAKLNLFLGCRNWGEAMLPRHLAHLATYFRRRSMNALFPVSMLGGAAAAALLLHAGLRGDAFEAVAFTLLATMMALAVLEHAFLMLPVALDGLWTWGRASRSLNQQAEGRARP